MEESPSSITSPSAMSISKQSEIVLGKNEDYIRLQAVARDLVNLVRDEDKRIKLLNQIDIPFFDASNPKEVSSKGRLTEELLNKVMNIEGTFVVGDLIRFIGLDLIADKAAPHEKLVSINELTAKLSQQINQIRTQLTAEWALPNDNASYYIPREEYQKKMVDYFGTTVSERRIVVVNAGLGGVGKTQLAINYVHHTNKDYRFKLWFSASSREQLLLKYRAFALEKGLVTEKAKTAEIIDAVRHWLTNNQGWLIVFDNVPDEGMMKEFLPSSGGDILITSRWQEWEFSNKIDVKVMTEAEAVALLKKSIDPDNRRVFTGPEEVELKSLAKKLGYLPLALAQAGAYIKSFRGHISIAKYEELFDKKLHSVLLLDRRLAGSQDHEPVAITWSISMEAMLKAAPESVELLYCCSHLHPEAIPQFLLEQFSIAPAKESSQLALNNAIRVAQEYSMISVDSQRQAITLHSLVQQVIRDQLGFDTGNKAFDYLCKEILAVKSTYPYGQDQVADYAKKRLLLSHLEELVKHLEDYINALKKTTQDNFGNIMKLETDLLLKTLLRLVDAYITFNNAHKEKKLLSWVLNILEHYNADPLEIAKTRRNLGNAYLELGDPGIAKEILEQVLKFQDAYEDQMRPSIDKAITLMSLGNTYGALGDTNKKKEFLERALELEERYYGLDHPSLATTLMNLGGAYGALGDVQKARSTLERALKIEEHHYGVDHPAVAKTLISVSNVCGILDDIPHKKAHLERALPILITYYGKDHCWVAIALMSLGNAFQLLGDTNNAKVNLKQALKIYENYYKRDTAEVALVLVNLGTLYISLGKVDKAKRFVERAFQAFKACYIKDNVDVAKALINLSKVYGSLDRVIQKNYLEQALKIFEGYYGNDHLEVGKLLKDISDVYENLGCYKQHQKTLLERALRILHKHCPNDLEVVEILNKLGAIYIDIGEEPEAKSLFENALSILKSPSSEARATSSEERANIAQLKMNIGVAYMKIGDIRNAIDLLEQARQTKEECYGPNHIEVALTLINLGCAFLESGDVQNAKEKLALAYKIEKGHLEKTHQPHSVNMAKILANLARAYKLFGNINQAKKYLEQALLIFKSHYGKNHPDVAKALDNLGKIYCILGSHNIDKSEKCHNRALLILGTYYDKDRPEIASVLCNLGLTCLKQGNIDRAVFHIQRGYDIFRGYPNFGENHPYTQNAKQLLDDITRVLTSAQNMQMLISSTVSSTAPMDAYAEMGRSWFERAKYYYEQGDLRNTIECYIKVIEIKPDFAGAHHNLACLYHVQGKIKLAEKHFILALQFEDKASTHADYGLLLLKQNRLLEAVKHFIAAILKGNDGSGLSYGKLEYKLLDNYLQSKIADNELQLQPLVMAHYWLAQCFQHLGDLALQQFYLQKFADSVQKSANSLYYQVLSYIYRGLGNIEQAEKYVTLALSQQNSQATSIKLSDVELKELYVDALVALEKESPTPLLYRVLEYTYACIGEKARSEEYAALASSLEASAIEKPKQSLVKANIYETHGLFAKPVERTGEVEKSNDTENFKQPKNHNS